MSQPHLSLSLSRELWNELLTAALPIQLAGGELDLRQAARGAVAQLGVRRRVVGLLEDKRTPAAVKKVGDRARDAWRARRPGLVKRAEQLVRVEGTWRVELDDLGTELRYGKQRVDADAYARGILEGTVWLLQENLEIPFVFERRLGASVALADIRYDRSKKAVVGSLSDLGLYVGDHAVLQLMARIGEAVLAQQLPRANPVTILERDRVAEMVGPMGGALKLNMGVETIDLRVDQDELKLEIRFGFTRKQLTDEEIAAQAEDGF